MWVQSGYKYSDHYVNKVRPLWESSSRARMNSKEESMNRANIISLYFRYFSFDQF